MMRVRERRFAISKLLNLSALHPFLQLRMAMGDNLLNIVRGADESMFCLITFVSILGLSFAKCGI